MSQDMSSKMFIIVASVILITMAVAIVLSILTQLPGYEDNHPPPPSPPPSKPYTLRVEVWVDKGCGATYFLGEDIVIYFRANKDAMLSLVDDYQWGKRVLFNGMVRKGKIYTYRDNIMLPSSYRRFSLYALEEKGRRAYDECMITIASKPPSCHPSYPDFCIPPPPPDLDCKDIPREKWNFRVRWDVPDPDPHHFDRDMDGIGCET